jgi:hypothetical protein
MTTVFMNVADIKCPDDPQGRTYRQINAEKKHSIPLGTLVEYRDGVRLFVVAYTRDWDGPSTFIYNNQQWLYDHHFGLYVIRNVKLLQGRL